MQKAACFTRNQSANQDPLTSKMAPWPEQGIGPKAPDKTSTKSIEISPAEEANVTLNVEDDLAWLDSASGGKTDEKPVEEKNPDVSNLNDGQLKALLDEALTYKCPKDREGKSNLFISLLSEAESDKPECGAGDGRRGNQGCSLDPGTSSRYYNSRRRGRKDAPTTVLEQNRGGSLQNLVHAFSNEFDSSFSYYTSHSSARSRKLKRGSKEYGVSVSARQREGGSLPSNVNVGLAFPGQEYRQSSAAATAALLFEDFTSIETRDREHSSSTDPKPVMNKDPGSLASSESKGPGEKEVVCESEMSAELEDVGANKKLDGEDAMFGENGHSMGGEEGTEMEVLKKRDVFTTRATFEVGLGDGKKARIKEQEQDVDLAIKFPLLQSDKANGVEPLQLPSTYNSVNCFLGQTERNGSTYQSLSTTGSTLSNSLRVDGTKTLITNVFPMQHVSVLAIPPNSSWIANAFASDTGKSLDENGNAVAHGHRDYNNGNERKSKTRRTKTNNDRNVVMSQNIEGHRGDKDIDSLLEFIESDKERKVKAGNKQHRSSLVSTDKGAKARERKLPQHLKGENNKLKKTNSLEEISKTKLEDLTSEKTGVLRKPKKPSTMDDSRVGDRRPWTNQEYEHFPSSRKKRRGEGREEGGAPPEETDFHVVTKKQRRKNRPGSSGCSDEARRARYNHQPRDAYQRRGFPPHDRDVLYQYHRPIPPDLRRKSASSMPPSDKSDSSDLDSVHSLPVSSTTPKLALDQTPQASYADIAKISTHPANINVGAAKWPAISGSLQAITSSKLNIGVPPISGKVTVPSGQSDDGHDPESLPVRFEPGSKPLDPRPKKNAVINTPVDIKVIPPYQTDDKFFVKQVVENSSNKVTLNNIQIEISDRTIKVSPAISSNDGVVKKKVVDLTSKQETVEEVGDLDSVVAVHESGVVAGLPTSEPQVLPTVDGAGVPISKVAKSDLSDSKSITKTGKVNTGSKKPSVSLSRTARPAVIILDEKESVFVSQNISASDITFGFEVNELLLLSDGEESLESSSFNSLNASERQSVDRTVVTEPGVSDQASPDHGEAAPDPDSSSISQLEGEALPADQSPQAANLNVPTEFETTPNQTTKVDEFFARFKSPITQLTESHTKIVNIIGLAWADVMQELESGGNVQYYDGQ